MAEPRNAQSFISPTPLSFGEKAGAIHFAVFPAPAKNAGAQVGFTHSCPCGCGRLSFVRFNEAEWPKGTTPMWQRTGDDETMTVAPSIGIYPQVDGVFHWHGYLKNGVFEEIE